ncbi:hypothetical protein QBC35DRAFT_488780 [Podospora australis]|uniref:Uncharacterized protein n=1 Tax=Podospora australis TaxID=1536484 RepID=A0AAN6WZD0_9PEZI|nr:hypothetical protein QBC35DRAFT_488780 [Podospora australis]
MGYALGALVHLFYSLGADYLVPLVVDHGDRVGFVYAVKGSCFMAAVMAVVFVAVGVALVRKHSKRVDAIGAMFKAYATRRVSRWTWLHPESDEDDVSFGPPWSYRVYHCA